MSPSPPLPGYRPDIQGLRAIAVLSVVAYHAGIPGLSGGYLGVDVFFVISGYLIGGHLLRELTQTDRLRFGAFYARRARRILPASLAVIAIAVITCVFLTPPLRAPVIATDGIWAALSAANLRFAILGTDYLADTTPSPLQHYWSLGIEEQFYLLVPILLLGLFLAFRSRRRALLTAGLLLTAASFALCLWWGSSSPWTYFTLPARAWELGLGVLAAGVATQAARAPLWCRQTAAMLGLSGLVAGAVLGGSSSFNHPGVGTLLPVIGTAVIILAGTGGELSRLVVSRLLSARPAQVIGRLSFSLYLVHWPILALAHENSNSELPLPLPTRVVLAILSLPLAWLLWRFVETPFLRKRIEPARARRPLLVAGAAIFALVISLTVTVPALAARPLTSDRAATSSVERLPTGTSYVPDNVRPALRSAAADTGALYTDGCQQGVSAAELKVCAFGPDGAPTVVLFGDSHAGRWFPALLAAFHGKPIRLVTLAKSECRSLESAKLWSGAQNRSCAAWRVSALRWLHDHPPQLLVLANHMGRSKRPAEATEGLWHDATESTLARFPAGVPVAVLAETPEFDFSPPVCLSRHLGDAGACSESRSLAVNSPVIAGERSGARAGGAALVDLTDWFCDAAVCPTIIGSSLVYTDEHHLSATYSAQLGPAVYAELAPLLGSG